MRLICGKWVEGETVGVRIENTTYRRVVRFNRHDGLYIVINNRKYFEYECEV